MTGLARTVVRLAPALAALGVWAAAAVGPPAEARQAEPRQAPVDELLPELESEIRRQMMEGRIPGLSIALVRDGAVVWARGYGYANLWSRTPATAVTVYTIGSTYKTLSAAAIARLHERGALVLDSPVSPHLGAIRIRGEDAARPVTFRHLLTHTSGMGNARGAADVWSDSLPPRLDDYLRTALALEQATASGVRYSNMAFALIPYLLERITGEDYRAHVRREFLHPLGMHDTDFRPTPSMVERLSVPYAPVGEGGLLAPVARYKAVDWAAGVVYGTAPDLARWLAVNLSGGALDGVRILDPATVRELHTIQFPEHRGPISGWGDERTGFGLGWWVRDRPDVRLIAHSGSVPGQTAFMVGAPDRGFGVVVLSNGHRAHAHLYAIAHRALELLGR